VNAHLSERPPDEWAARLSFPQLDPATEGHWPPSLSTEFAGSLRTRLWREALNARSDAFIEVSENSAHYVGPLIMTPMWARVERKGAIIIPASAIIKSRMHFWTEAHVRAIRLRLGPLVEALQADGGDVGPALERLRDRGLLPIGMTTPAAPARHRADEALAKHRPQKGDTKKGWSDRAASTPEEAKTFQNWLAANDDVWRARGGDPVKPRRSKRRAV
jgi:hypothetical protein